MKKFRAWDPTTGKMYYPPNLHIYMNIDGTCINFQNNEILEVMFELELQDKNGKNAYGNDIVKIDDPYLLSHTINSLGIIIWNGNYWIFAGSLKKDGTIETIHGKSEFYMRGKYDFEILGNVKQNKIEDFQ